MKKDLKDYIARCPECQLNRSASRTHAPLPIRPVPPVALPFERWGIDFYGPMVETKSGSYSDSTHAVTGLLAILLIFGTHPRLPTTKHPPRSSLMPLDEIERMEENSEFIARNLEKLVKHDQQQMSGPRLKLKPCEKRKRLRRKHIGLITSKLATW
ncbi:hypothetical protein BASA83_013108 [Batrachochytrium salamandrivorans]|nr:hypothetical protein BASA83_013108 [Batrachochytrium salamandrivorans]